MLLCALCGKKKPQLICQDQQCYNSTSGRVPRSQNKPYFITRNAGNAKPVATTDYCGSLSLRLTLLPEPGAETRRTFSCGGILEPCKFLILFPSPLRAFTLLFCAICCQSRRVGVVFFFFPDSYFLGLYSVDKVSSEFLFLLKNITSVGRDVGNSFCPTEKKNTMLLFW